MLRMNEFLKAFIGTFLTLLLMVNVIYAFNLTRSLGMPFVYTSTVTSYSDKYFGVTTLIESFKSFFGNNSAINGYKSVLAYWYNIMSRFDITNLMGYRDLWNYAINSGNNGIATLFSIFTVLIGLVQLLANIPYVTMILIYFLLFLFYVFSIIFLGLSYACYLFSGLAYAYLPDTTFPDVEDILDGTYTFINYLI